VPVERVSQGFKDISMTFQSNPLNDDLIAIKNENAVARSIRNIVFTLPGEKFFSASFGSRITESLFENIDDINATLIADEIRESININEPRVELRNVEAFADFKNNGFDVIITYNVIGSEIPSQELQFVLQSSR
jgi:phage baseplate assembly protein W